MYFEIPGISLQRFICLSNIYLLWWYIISFLKYFNLLFFMNFYKSALPLMLHTSKIALNSFNLPLSSNISSCHLLLLHGWCWCLFRGFCSWHGGTVFFCFFPNHFTHYWGKSWFQLESFKIYLKGLCGLLLLHFYVKLGSGLATGFCFFLFQNCQWRERE